LRLPGKGRVASGAVLVACAVGFGVWATLTKDSAAFGRQTGLAGVYSLALAAVVAAVAMTGWAARRRQPQAAVPSAGEAVRAEISGGQGVRLAHAMSR